MVTSSRQHCRPGSHRATGDTGPPPLPSERVDEARHCAAAVLGYAQPMALEDHSDLGSSAAPDLELKLAVTPEQMRRLRHHPLVASAHPSRRSLARTYFDTPDLALHRRSLDLRVGKEGHRYVQTLTGSNGKASIPPTALAWQSPVPGAAPDLSRL